jgi:zinc transport system substrate-binding protein
VIAVWRLGALLLAVLVLSGCRGVGDDDGPTVVAAFYPLAWAAEEIAGDDVEVVNLTPPGAEPHDINDGELIFYLGQGFMPALEDAVEGRAGAVDLLEGQSLREGTDEHGHGGEGETGEALEGDEEELERDPHVWLDPTRLATIARTIAAELGEPGAEADLVAELEQLDEDYRAGLANCKRREIVTSHAAFGYLAARYDLEQIPITGVAPEAEPSARELEEVVDEVREHGATTVFFETLVSPRLAETVAREAGVTSAVLNPLEGLTQEQLDQGEDYFSVMRDNLAALRAALGCR